MNVTNRPASDVLRSVTHRVGVREVAEANEFFGFGLSLLLHPCPWSLSLSFVERRDIDFRSESVLQMVEADESSSIASKVQFYFSSFALTFLVAHTYRPLEIIDQSADSLGPAFG